MLGSKIVMQFCYIFSIQLIYGEVIHQKSAGNVCQQQKTKQATYNALQHEYLTLQFLT